LLKYNTFSLHPASKNALEANFVKKSKRGGICFCVGADSIFKGRYIKGVVL